MRTVIVARVHFKIFKLPFRPTNIHRICSKYKTFESHNSNEDELDNRGSTVLSNACEIILIKSIVRLLVGLLGASLITGEVSMLNLTSSNQTGYTLCTSQVCNKARILITENIKPSVNPCDDFYEHACGGWVEKNSMNKELGSYTQSNELLDIIISQIKGLFKSSRIVHQKQNFINILSEFSPFTELLETDSTSDIEAVRKVKEIYRSCLRELCLKDLKIINGLL